MVYEKRGQREVRTRGAVADGARLPRLGAWVSLRRGRSAAAPFSLFRRSVDAFLSHVFFRDRTYMA